MEQRYVEEAAFEELQRKIEKICRENSLMCKFVNGDPIRLVIWPDMSMEGQLSMLDEPAGHTGHGQPEHGPRHPPPAEEEPVPEDLPWEE